MTTTTSTANVDIATLRHAVRGAVLAPGDEGWDNERTPWNVAFEQQPALIVVPQSSTTCRPRCSSRRPTACASPRRAPATASRARRPLRRRPDPHARAARCRDRRRRAPGARRSGRALGRGRRPRGRARPRRPARLLAGCRRRRLHARRRHGLARPQARPGRQRGHGDRARHGRRRVPPRRPHPRARPLLRAARRRRQLRRRHGDGVRALPARAGLRRLADLGLGGVRARAHGLARLDRDDARTRSPRSAASSSSRRSS